jgi:hypothetical protein
MRREGERGSGRKSNIGKEDERERQQRQREVEIDSFSFCITLPLSCLCLFISFCLFFFPLSHPLSQYCSFSPSLPLSPALLILICYRSIFLLSLYNSPSLLSLSFHLLLSLLLPSLSSSFSILLFLPLSPSLPCSLHIDLL